MIKNTGKAAQLEFIALMKKDRPKAWIYRFEDQSDLVGINNGRRIGSRAKPSDFIVVCPKYGTYFAEVKSSHQKVSFRFSQFEATQIGFAKLVCKAGGRYVAYVKNMLTDEWYAIPWPFIQQVMESGDASIKWQHLRGEGCLWER